MPKKRKKYWLAAALFTVLTAISCHYFLDTEDWEVRSARLPEAFDGLRVTMVCDVHGARFGNGSRRLLQAVTVSRPDLIAICGDLADEVTDRTMLTPLLQGLCAIAPCYYVTGNHEWARPDTEDLLQQIAACGVTVLRNDWLALERDGQTLVLAGAEDRNAYRDQETPEELVARIHRETASDPYLLMLYHRNDSLPLWQTLQPDLVLAGHGHGGVIRLPFLGGLLGVNRKFFPKDCEGLYTAGRTTLAVSRGLGGARLWNRPHLPTVVLRAIP